MVNKTYSLLVSGCPDIPETCETWRKYTPIAESVSGLLPTTTCPISRSAYACAVIELSMASRLYSYIKEKDPYNTYTADDIDLQKDGPSLVFPYMVDLNYSKIMQASRHVPKEIRDAVNMDDPADIAALLCLSLLYLDIIREVHNA